MNKKVMAMCDKRNQLIMQAVLDRLSSGTGIYTSEDILTVANIKEKNLKELLEKMKSNVVEMTKEE